MHYLVGSFAAIALVVTVYAETGTESFTSGDGNHTPESLDTRPSMNWMADARFGMFIHFGLYSIPAGVWKGEEMGRNHYAEWIRTQWGWPRSNSGIPKPDYDTLLGEFNPTEFDAEQWIGLAAEAGMKYFVITSKHHDGFALWDSEVSDYDIAATPFGAGGRDLLGELAAACRRHGIKLGFYYSHWQDWEHPGGARPPWQEIRPDPHVEQPSDDAFARYWESKCLPQVSELIDRYHPDMLWFDSWGQAARNQITRERRDQLIALIRKKAPTCMINGRIAAHDPAGADFISMGDNQFPTAENAPRVPWETPATMNHSWGYHRLDFQWKSFGTLIDQLITNAHHGGSITLNVGPMRNGAFQQAAIRRLKQFAAWMDIHECALHDTRRSPFAEGGLPDHVRATTGRDPARPLFHLFLLDPPQGGGELVIPQPLDIDEDEPFLVQVLETREFLPVVRTGDKLAITLPRNLADLDHPVLLVGPASSIPNRYEDGVEIMPVKPGDFRR